MGGKVVGEVPTSLPTYLPTYPPTSLPTYLRVWRFGFGVGGSQGQKRLESGGRFLDSVLALVPLCTPCWCAAQGLRWGVEHPTLHPKCLQGWGLLRTSLVRKCPVLGTYRRTTPKALVVLGGGRAFSYGRGTPVGWCKFWVRSPVLGTRERDSGERGSRECLNPVWVQEKGGRGNMSRFGPGARTSRSSFFTAGVATSRAVHPYCPVRMCVRALLCQSLM